MWRLLFFCTLVLAKEVWNVKVAQPQVFAINHGVRYIDTVQDYSIFESTHYTSNAFFATDGLHRDERRKHYKRSADPLFPQQWHLHTLNIAQVHRTGRGVTVAIVDDGLESTHPDLQPNFDASLSWDFNHNRPNVIPSHSDGHGTAAAGVCCAVAHNGICGQGVAPSAKLIGLELISAATYDYQEAQAFSRNAGKIHIYSNSWGPEDSGRHMDGPGRITKAALKRLNQIVVWAAGNGHENQDNINYDGYANSPYTLAIGAVDHNGQPAWYSERGACLFAVAPSSGAGLGITTTDLAGSYGYSRGLCTNQFGGTSSAAPLAAGIFALMLEENPRLSQRDIMHIVAKISKHGHTHDKGFGLLEIPPLLEAAKTHVHVPDMTKRKSGVIMVNKPIPEDGSWLVQRITVPTGLQFIEQIGVTVHMLHGRHGQVLVELGDSVLAEHRGDVHGGSSIWTYTTLHEWGNSSRVWDFRIRDDTVDEFTGMLISVSLTLYGY